MPPGAGPPGTAPPPRPPGAPAPGLGAGKELPGTSPSHRGWGWAVRAAGPEGASTLRRAAGSRRRAGAAGQRQVQRGAGPGLHLHGRGRGRGRGRGLPSSRPSSRALRARD